MVDSPVIQELRVNDLLDNLLLDLSPEVLGRDAVGVLGRHDDGVNSQRDHGSILLPVLDGDLGLRVGPEPVHSARSPGDSHGEIQLVGKHNSEGHEFLGFVRSITEHDTLVTSAHGFESSVVEALCDIGTLLLNGHKNIARLVIETFLRVVVSDPLDGLADDLLVVELGLGGDLTKDHDHTSLGCSFACDLGEGVLREAGIELGENFQYAVYRRLKMKKHVQ